MHKIKLAVMLLIVCIVFSNAIEGHASAADQQKYYMICYMIYKNNLDNDIEIELGRQELIMVQAYGNIDLSNLTIFPLKKNIHVPFSIEEMGTEEAEMEALTEEIRCYLLNYGYAKLNDNTIATDKELEAQEHAKSKLLGGWQETTDKQDGGETEGGIGWGWLSEVVAYICRNYQFVISTVISLGVLAYLYKKFHTIKKNVFLGGANGCGKTTLLTHLLVPDVSPQDLLNRSPTLKLNK